MPVGQSEGMFFWDRVGEMEAFLGKKYKLETSENFDEFMKALDVGWSPVGRTVGSTITFEGSKMIHESRGEKNSKFIREYTPEIMTAILTVDDVISTRVYKLQE